MASFQFNGELAAAVEAGDVNIATSVEQRLEAFLANEAGDITGVTAGLGISGGGTSGDVSVAFAPSELSNATVATDDKIVIADTDDSDNPKTVTVSSVVALAPQGDITAVTAGTALTGGGSSGDVTLNFAPSELSSATVATDDKVVIADTNDSDNPKTVTAQSIADLAPQGDITSVVAGTNLNGGGTSGDVTLNVDASPTFTTVKIVDTNTVLDEGAGNSLRITTDNGDLDIGNQTGSGGHIYTDKNNLFIGLGGSAEIGADLTTLFDYNGDDFRDGSSSGDNKLLGTAAKPWHTLHLGQRAAGGGTRRELIRLDVQGTSSGTDQDLAIGDGSGLTFYVPNNDSSAVGAEIAGLKDSNTDANSAGKLCFYTKPNGGTLTKQFSIGSDGYFWANKWEWNTWDPDAVGMGNATRSAGSHLAGQYAEVGDLVFWRFYWQLQAGEDITGTFSFTVPVTGVSASGSYSPSGQFWYFDSGTAYFVGHTMLYGASTIYPYANKQTSGVGDYEYAANITASQPMNWTTGDTMYGAGCYRRVAQSEN